MPARIDVLRRSLLAWPLWAAAGHLLAAPASAYALSLQFVDDSGASRALTEWRGKPIVIAMAYGACRSICSTTLRVLEEVQAAADRRGEALAFIVVGIDPAEDTPQDWARYRQLR